MNHVLAFPMEPANRLGAEAYDEEFERVLEAGWEVGGFHYIFETFDDMLIDQWVNDAAAEFVRVREDPIQEITPTGLRTGTAEYEFDVIIYATGFDAIARTARPDERARRRRPHHHRAVDGRRPSAVRAGSRAAQTGFGWSCAQDGRPESVEQ